MKGEKGWPEVPLAKLQWGYISLWLAELALDVLGPTGALLKGAPGAVDGGMWARNYVWQRYTTIGAGPTEVQKNIIADRALKLERWLSEWVSLNRERGAKLTGARSRITAAPERAICAAPLAHSAP